jgi:FMN phosphatase YigB (HAD superfamily)
MVKAVTFDFWNTLVRVPGEAFPEARRRAVAAACEDCEVEIGVEDLTAQLAEVVRSRDRSWRAGVHFPPKKGAEMLVGALGVEGRAAEQVSQAFLTAGQDLDLELASGIRPCLSGLEQRGIRIGIVCDAGFMGGADLRRMLAAKDLLRHFRGWAFSDEVGHYKPAPEIFEAALSALEARPEEAMHVGDLRRTDVLGAQRLGMKTVRYSGINDDADCGSGVEADFIFDDHAELLRVIEAPKS